MISAPARKTQSLPIGSFRSGIGHVRLQAAGAHAAVLEPADPVAARAARVELLERRRIARRSCRQQLARQDGLSAEHVLVQGEVVGVAAFENPEGVVPGHLLVEGVDAAAPGSDRTRRPRR